MKTIRAFTIEACEQAANAYGLPIVGQMPRMAEFYRRRVNEQLRAARAINDAASIADAKAKLDLLRWIDGWISSVGRNWGPERGDRLDVTHKMVGSLAMIGYALRLLVQAHVDHPQFRAEWLRPKD